MTKNNNQAIRIMQTQIRTTRIKMKIQIQRQTQIQSQLIRTLKAQNQNN